MGMHCSTVHRRLKALGVKLRKAGRQKKPKKQKYKPSMFNKVTLRHMKRHYEEGRSLQEVADIYKTNKSAVGRELTKIGVKMRPPQKRGVFKPLQNRKHLLCADDMLEAAKDKVTLGISWQELANHYKVSKGLCYYLVKPYVDTLISQ